MDKRLRSVCFSASIAMVVYFLSASFVIDHTYKRRWSDLVYARVYWAIQEEWFGREVAHWYYYRVCRMKLLVPLIDRSR